MSKPKPPKVEPWVKTLIIGGIIWILGEVAFKLGTEENDLSSFGWIGRILGILIIAVGVYLKVKRKNKII